MASRMYVRLNEHDRTNVLRLFLEPEFYFKTYTPTLLSSWEIDALLRNNTVVVLSGDGEPQGLAEFEQIGGPFSDHFRLHLRLSSTNPPGGWMETYQELLRELHAVMPVNRVTFVCYEFDTAGRRFARLAGFRLDGQLSRMVRLNGREYAMLYFSFLPGRTTTGSPPATPIPQQAAKVEDPDPGIPTRPWTKARGLRSTDLDFLELDRSRARIEAITSLWDARPRPPFGLTLDLALVKRGGLGRMYWIPGIGLVWFQEVDFVDGHALLHVALENAWNEDQARTALDVSLSLGFDVLNLHKLYGLVPRTATHTRDVLSRAGFRPEATLPRGFRDQGVTVDAELWGVVAGAG